MYASANPSTLNSLTSELCLAAALKPLVPGDRAAAALAARHPHAGVLLAVDDAPAHLRRAERGPSTRESLCAHARTHHDRRVVVGVERDRPAAEPEVAEAADEAGGGADAVLELLAAAAVAVLLDAPEVRQLARVERPQRAAGLPRHPLPAVHAQEAVAVVPEQDSFFSWRPLYCLQEWGRGI